MILTTIQFHTKERILISFRRIAPGFVTEETVQVLVARGKVLELLRPDEAGKVQCILSTEVRAVGSFRPFGKWTKVERLLRTS